LGVLGVDASVLTRYRPAGRRDLRPLSRHARCAGAHVRHRPPPR
jgi:hypothetical protein